MESITGRDRSNHRKCRTRRAEHEIADKLFTSAMTLRILLPPKLSYLVTRNPHSAIRLCYKLPLSLTEDPMSTTRRTDAPPRRPLTELMDRQPPFDLQAEIGVLGSIVLLPDVLDDVVMVLRPDDFYDDAHR